MKRQGAFMYTVLMLYPGPVSAEDSNPMTYMAWVWADDHRDAKKRAQLEALNAQPSRLRTKAKDWRVLFITPGHHQCYGSGR